MKHAIFLINLNQDVAVARSVAIFFRREFAASISFIVSAPFRKRDATQLWFRELQELARELEASVKEVKDVAEAVQALCGKSGLLLAPSESVLLAHDFSNQVFLAAPQNFLRVTLQHGLECIGFNHNGAHNRNWSYYIGMSCDIAASWFEQDALFSVKGDQSSKIVAVGPPIGLDAPCVTERTGRYDHEIHGLVCENLHSVRFHSDDKNSFVDCFTSFAENFDKLGGTLELRPHPGGRYLEKNKISLPRNVRMNRHPLYKQTLKKFAFGISGPSSVVLDMIWAGMPVAVWASGRAGNDLAMYSMLHKVSSHDEWLEFALAAARDPQIFVDRQTRFVQSLGIPDNIPERYRGLGRLALG